MFILYANIYSFCLYTIFCFYEKGTYICFSHILNDMRLFIFVFISFIFFTVVGTLSHEAGHWIVGKLLRAEKAKIGYAYTIVEGLPDETLLTEIYNRNKQAIINKQSFAEKDRWEQLNKRLNFQYFLITCGGVAQTIFTGTLGFLVLWWRGKRFYTQEGVSWTGWFWLFLALFWLRQSANFVMGLVFSFLNSQREHYDDETQIMQYLGLPPYSFDLVTALFGFFVLAWITFYYLPAKQRFVFLVAGFFGGIAGFILWLEWLGKYILP